MNTLEPNMYVRTKDGYIDKILDISVDWYYSEEDEEDKPYKIYKLSKYYYDEEFDEDNDWVLESFLIKASHNIIDLIQENDYVNGYKVSFKGNDYKPFVQCDYPVLVGTTNHYRFYEEAIYSIVTKEQFESMQYRIGE